MDSSAVRPLKDAEKWWDYLKTKGADYGYCPKPAKIILIIKESLWKSAHNFLTTQA